NALLMVSSGTRLGMVLSRLSRLKPHLVATTMLAGILGIAYGTLKAGLLVKGWIMAPPRLLHEEMEDFLTYKENEARLRALEKEQTH
ncbi:hypothetical protein V3C99_000515, partial [Haemonchus contortus]